MKFLVFSIFILGHCSRCHMSVVDFNMADNDNPTGSLSINYRTSQDSRRTTPITVSGMITESPSTARRVVVFTIDEVLCERAQTKHRRYGKMPHTLSLAECPKVWATSWEDEPYLRIFWPHLQFLFDYLLEHGVRIAFATQYDLSQNLAIHEQLRYFFGSEKFEVLKLEGQFRIHALIGDAYLNNNSSLGGKGVFVKRSRQIIQDGESLSNAVLVDGALNHAYPDDLFIIQVQLFFRNEGLWDYNSLNNVYYLLGLFTTYFGNEKYEKLPLAEAMAQILQPSPKDYCEDCYGNTSTPSTMPCHFLRCHPVLQEMVGVGFAWVREKVPDAILYEKFKD